MARIDVPMFKGAVRKVSPRLLPDDVATYARNCRVDSGGLVPLKATQEQAADLRAGVTRSIFLYEDAHWFSWNTTVSAIKSPIAQDDWARVYYTGDGVPKVTSGAIATGSPPLPSAAYTLGVQAPASSIGAAAFPGDPDPSPDDFSDDETRYYTMTYVTGYGEEGPPGPPSNALELTYPHMQYVALTLPIPVTNTENITHKRIYCTRTDGAATDFYLIAEVPLATAEYTHPAGAVLGKLLDTEDFVAPPDNMRGLVMMPNGIAAGFAGNEVCFSEPFLPYAWPTAYRRSTEHDVVAMAVTGASLVAATEGYPYIYSGASPDAITEQKIEILQACVSARSMVDMGAYVLYASPDGLVMVSDSRAEVITRDILSKEQWAAYYPETILAFHYDGQYIAFWGDTEGFGAGRGGFVFDPETRTFVELDFYFSAGFNHLVNDTLYLARHSIQEFTNALHVWEGSDTALTYHWHSKEFAIPDSPMACLRIESDNPRRVGVTIRVDGQVAFRLSSMPSETVRLSPQCRGKVWQIELTASTPVHRVTLAQAMAELG